MIVKTLELDFFRNYVHLEAAFDPRVNLIYGDNAQGKTNLLEAIAYLSSARSHRARYDREMIQMGVDSAFLKGEVVSRDRTTYNTCRAVQEQGLRQGLQDLVEAMNALCDLYGLSPTGEVEVNISFGDSVFEDVQQEFDRRLRLVEAGCLRPEKLIGWYLHLDEESAKAELPEKGGT